MVAKVQGSRRMRKQQVGWMDGWMITIGWEELQIVTWDRLKLRKFIYLSMSASVVHNYYMEQFCLLLKFLQPAKFASYRLLGLFEGFPLPSFSYLSYHVQQRGHVMDSAASRVTSGGPQVVGLSYCGACTMESSPT